MRLSMLYALPVAVAILAGCSSTEGPQIGPVEELYNNAMDNMEQGQFIKALKTFEELDRQHPYSLWATRAQMMIAYAQFRTGEFDEAIAAADRFIRLHPGHKDLAYLYYLRGLSYYFRISDVTRDQGHTLDAMRAFEEVVQRFPKTDYARDAQLKITLCRDHLAGQEMSVGRFYQSQKRYLAAIKRFRKVVDDYQTTTQTPEALYRLTESYLAVGIPEEAKRSAAILGFNYPGSTWYRDAYALLTERKLADPGQEKTWATQIFKGLKEMF